jgi:transposase
MRRSPDAHDDR